ncbi:hypothetical protein WN48_10101 [Eufriesea mexicana]|nr:hypothetical protein WN48_10101 [Eufriesea mexicana]
MTACYSREQDGKRFSVGYEIGMEKGDVDATRRVIQVIYSTNDCARIGYGMSGGRDWSDGESDPREVKPLFTRLKSIVSNKSASRDRRQKSSSNYNTREITARCQEEDQITQVPKEATSNLISSDFFRYPPSNGTHPIPGERVI